MVKIGRRFYMDLINNSINDFEAKKIDFGRLVWELERTIETVKDKSYKNGKLLWDLWGELEIIYAFGLHDQQEDPTKTFIFDLEEIKSVTSKIRELCR